MRYILTFIIHLVFGQDPKYMAASQNARSGSTPKTHRRSRPPIQTCDPDRSRPHDPDRSRPHDPDPFVLCWLDIFFFKVLKSITVYYKVLLQYYKVLLQYYKVTLCTTKYDAGWSREFWKNLAIPFQTSFQTVPDPFQTSSMESKGRVHSQPCCPRRKNRSVRPVQNHLIQFKSYMKWLSWFQALRSRRAEKTFYESGRSRRPDHRGTIQTRLSTHAHMNIYIYTHLFWNIYIYVHIHPFMFPSNSVLRSHLTVSWCWWKVGDFSSCFHEALEPGIKFCINLVHSNVGGFSGNFEKEIDTKKCRYDAWACIFIASTKCRISDLEPCNLNCT